MMQTRQFPLQARAERLLPENPLFRLLVVNGAIGFAVAMITFGGLLATNAAGLHDLIATSENPVVPLVLLAFGLTITLGSAVMGSAIMLLPADDQPTSGRRGRVEGELIPVRVHAVARRRDYSRD